MAMAMDSQRNFWKGFLVFESKNLLNKEINLCEMGGQLRLFLRYHFTDIFEAQFAGKAISVRQFTGILGRTDIPAIYRKKIAEPRLQMNRANDFARE